MATEAAQTTIKLGDISINAYQLEDGSYAAPGLLKLAHADVYSYGECWYWLGGPPPDLEYRRYWDKKRGAFLAFQGNRLSYLYVDPADTEREICYVPLLSDLQSVIDFCVLGKLFSANTLSRLRRTLDYCYSTYGIDSPLNDAFFLRNTEYINAHLFGLSPLGAKDTKSFSTPKNHYKEVPKELSAVIYLVKLDSHLKLGFTRNLDQRLKSFRSANVRVELITSIEGTLRMERRLHSILGSKVRELYDFEDEQRIIEAMDLSLRAPSLVFGHSLRN